MKTLFFSNLLNPCVNKLFFIFGYLFFLLYAFQARSGETFITETVWVENRSPIMQLFSLSRPDFYPNQTTGTITWSPRLEVVNYISSTRKGGDFIFIDGETWQISNTLRFQLNPQTQIQATLPWIKHNEGLFDNFIYHFHELFQLLQNGRTQEFNDRMTWIFESNGEQVLLYEENTSALGDLQLKLFWTPESKRNIQLSGLLKLPTGNFAHQTGSENIDIGFSATHMNPDWFRQREFLEHKTLAFWYGAGISYIGKAQKLKDFDNYPLSLTFRSGLALEISPKWQLKIQADTNSPLFNTKIRELGWFPVQLTTAIAHTINESTQVDFSIIEDLRPRSAPDVIFNSGLSIHF